MGLRREASADQEVVEALAVLEDLPLEGMVGSVAWAVLVELAEAGATGQRAVPVERAAPAAWVV